MFEFAAPLTAVAGDPFWVNATRFLILFTAGALTGFIYQWARRHWYHCVAAGAMLLAGLMFVAYHIAQGGYSTYPLANVAPFAGLALLVVSCVTLRRNAHEREVSRSVGQ